MHWFKIREYVISDAASVLFYSGLGLQCYWHLSWRVEEMEKKIVLIHDPIIMLQLSIFMTVYMIYSAIECVRELLS